MSFFLRHFAGFLIQIGGGMVLCMFSFTKEAFRYPRKWVIAGYTALTILFSAGFPLVMCIPLFQGAQYQSLAATAYMLFVILLFTVLYFWIIRAEIIKKLVVLVLVLFYTATQYLLVNLVMPLFPDSVLPDVYPPLGLALYAGMAAILFPLAVVFMLRVVREYLAEVELKNIRREFGAVLLLTILYLFMMVLYFSLLDGLMEVFWWWLIPPFLLTMAVLGVFYWTLFRESVRRKRDSEERKALEIQKLQYESITREMENARRMRHDLRHYLNGLADLLEQDKAEEMKDYLAQVIDRASRRENETYCLNPVINGLLQYYAGLAGQEGIRCQVQADCGELTVSAADLTVMLGNTMENAIRSCKSCGNDGWITIQIGVIGGSLVMQVENPCVHIHPTGRYPLDGAFLPAAAFASTREGGGYGLSSIEHTAQRYGGDAFFRYDEQAKTFTTRIRLNLHPEML